MAGTSEKTDHGEVLTRFEEMFGTVVEHEVIKLILQSCDWDTVAASDTLLGMIDKTDLPSHVLSALTADSIIRGLSKNEPPIVSHEASKTSTQLSSYGLGGLCVDLEPETQSRSSNVSVITSHKSDNAVGDLEGQRELESLQRIFQTYSGGTKTSTETSSDASSKTTSRKSDFGASSTSNHIYSSPFMQERTEANEVERQNGNIGTAGPGTSITSLSMRKDSTSTSSSALPYALTTSPTQSHARIDGAAAVGSRLSSEASKNSDRESIFSSPSLSPHMLNKNVSEGDMLQLKTSQWVNSSEFMPNSSEVGNKGGSSTLMPVLSSSSEKKERKASKKNKIIHKILQGKKILVLMRGLPGSGKSTIARELKGASSGAVLSTDDFFYDKQGNYLYDVARIGEAHQWNKHRAIQRLKDGKTPIIIDNTNLQRWEMKPYVKLALQYGYDVDLLDADTPWRLNHMELARKNTHGVPAKKIKDMKERYELNVEIEDMVAELQDELTQTSPSKTMISQTHKETAITNESRQTGDTIFSPAECPKKPPTVSQSAEQTTFNYESNVLLTREEREFDDISDEDVVVEGYDEGDDNPVEIHVSPADDEVGVIEVYQNTIDSEDLSEHGEPDNEDASKVPVEKNESCSQEDGPTVSLDTFVDLTEALVSCSGKEERQDQDQLLSEAKRIDNFSEEHPIDYDEAKMQCLLNEASKSIDISNTDAEWDNLTADISTADLNDEKFNDLVSSFGSALKKQLENVESKEAPASTKESSAAEKSVSEDLAMYDLISTVEDKTGQSLSALVTELVNKDNESSVNKSFKADDHGEEKASNREKQEIENSETMEDLVSKFSGIKLSINDSSVEDVDIREHREKLWEFDRDGTAKEPSLRANCEKKEEDGVLRIIEGDKAAPIKVGGPLPERNANLQVENESLVSWECVNINAGMSSATWDVKASSTPDADDRDSKPCRTQWKREAGDPSKWLNDLGKQDESESNVDEAVLSWVAVDGITPDWDEKASQKNSIQEKSTDKNGGKSAAPKYLMVEESQSHTGAVSKIRKQKRRSHSSSPDSKRLGKKDKPIITVGREEPSKEAETQTLSIDFEALQLNHELYELKVLFGRPHYVPVTSVKCSFSTEGPLTKGALKLEKGTMTEDLNEGSVMSFQTLVAFFPTIPKEDLRDVFEKCRYDSDWAMNVLLDGGYEMSDPSDSSIVKVPEEDFETDSFSETTNTDEGKNDQSSCDASDVASDNFVDERARKVRQSQQPDDLARKEEIEKSFALPKSIDDRVLRLTGKQYDDLNMTKVKKTKGKKVNGKGNGSASNIRTEETVEGDIEGAQYVTLVMDPLFASQLNMMFGPVGDYEISGDLTYEDRSVVLPLEVCEMLHKYWARTVNGKFQHEAEILDSLVCQDEILARKLQEEENAAFNLNTDADEETHDGFLEDKPVAFQEIMDLEQALQESLAGKTTPEDTSISAVLSLKRLYKEYPHVDPVALKEEFNKNGKRYQVTVQKLNQKFGKEQGIPKTVIAPEALDRYEQEMIERAQQESLAEQEACEASNHHEDIVPDDPQVFRDEAQAHYHQRQEAFQKAQEASRRGMKAAAAYYAYIGNLHSEKLREANQRASQKILEARNAHRKDANCLDLHLLHVPEAVSATQAFLHERQRVLIARGIRQIEVSLITGRGIHSAGGQAVLKPAIKEHLKKNGYSFFEANSGMLKVILRGKPS